jgi:hypothetical protein
MAVARIFDGKGWTSSQYDSLIAKLAEQLGLKPGQSAPGVLFHWAAPTDEGIRAVDVYDSVDSADRLVQGSVGPIAAELGLTLQEITQYEVHGFLAP